MLPLDYTLFNNAVPASLNGAMMGFTPTWGYPMPNAAPFDSPLPGLDEANAETVYHLDAGTNCWLLEYLRGFRLRKRIKLMEGFTIDKVRYIYDMPCKQLQAVVVVYTDRRGTHTVVIPADDFQAGKLLKYFPSLVRLPDCSKRQANDLLEYLIQRASFSETVQLYSHQGFLTRQDGGLTFVAVPSVQSELRNLCPRSCIMRSWHHVGRAQSEVFKEWGEIYCGHPVLKTLALLRIAALLLSFVPPQIQHSQLMWIIQPSVGVTEEQLVALLNANDYTKYPTPVLNTGSEKLQEALSEVWDGAAVFVDHSFADEEDRRRDAMKLLLRAACGDLCEAEIGRNIITVISRNGASTAKALKPERVVTLSTEGAKLEADSETLARVNGEVEAIFVTTFLRNAPYLQEVFLQYLPLMNAEYAKSLSTEYAASVTLLAAVMYIIEHAFHVKLTGDGYAVWLDELEKQGSVMESDRAIRQDFASVLSTQFRSGVFTAVRKRNNLCFDTESLTAVVSGNRLYVSDDMLSGVLAEMYTTHSKKSLIDSLAAEGVLNRKDGDSHPIDVHSPSGRHIRLYLYDICTDILDADIIDYLANLEQTAFWLTQGEMPPFDFLPILCNVTGQTAGRKVDYVSEDNSSCYITGQSGFGKSFLMCQLMAKNAALGHRVIAFDTSNSFTREALCRNLPQDYVDKTIGFHKIEEDGIPVDLFDFNRQAKLPTQKQELLGILRAGTGELTAPQTNTLRTALSKLLSELKPGGAFEPTRLLSLLSEGELKNDSLQNLLEPLFDDITGYGMGSSGWGDFLENSKPILVISLNSDKSENANQIIEMLLHTLYNFQREHPQTPLDIFIDEIQNQNFGQDSPLRKIMKEGRKTHLSFYGATLDYEPRNTERGSVMGKAGTQIFLRPTQDSERRVADELRFGKNDAARFDTMQRGDVIVKGSLYSKEIERNLPTILSGRVQPFEDYTTSP